MTNITTANTRGIRILIISSTSGLSMYAMNSDRSKMSNMLIE